MALHGYIPKQKKRTYLGPAAENKKRIIEKHSAMLNATATLEKIAKPRKRLHKISSRHRIELALYTHLKLEFIGRNKINRSFDLHHIRGRMGTLLIDARFWKFITRDDHNFVQNNPLRARHYGLLCQPGKWNNAPDDEITRQLKDIMFLARTSMKEAKQQLVKLFYP